MHLFLLETNNIVNEHGGYLGYQKTKERLQKYRTILQAGEIECPADLNQKGKKESNRKVEICWVD